MVPPVKETRNREKGKWREEMVFSLFFFFLAPPGYDLNTAIYLLFYSYFNESTVFAVAAFIVKMPIAAIAIARVDMPAITKIHGLMST